MKKIKTMSVSKFVEGYLACKSEDELREYVEKNLIVATYVPYMTKVVVAQDLVNKSVYDGFGNIHVDSSVYYVFTYKCLLELYTNLRSDSDNFTMDYDKLYASGLLDALFFGAHADDGRDIPSLIPAREIAEFKMIADMLHNDAIKNNYEPHAFISKQFEKTRIFINEFANEYSVKIPQIIDGLDDIQIAKVNKIIDKIKGSGSKKNSKQK